MTLKVHTWPPGEPRPKTGTLKPLGKWHRLWQRLRLRDRARGEETIANLMVLGYGPDHANPAFIYGIAPSGQVWIPIAGAGLTPKAVGVLRLPVIEVLGKNGPAPWGGLLIPAWVAYFSTALPDRPKVFGVLDKIRQIAQDFLDAQRRPLPHEVGQLSFGA